MCIVCGCAEIAQNALSVEETRLCEHIQGSIVIAAQSSVLRICVIDNSSERVMMLEESRTGDE